MDTQETNLFPIYEFARALLDAIELGQPPLIAAAGDLTARCVIQQWPQRREVVALAHDGLELRTSDAYQALAEAILGLSEPTALGDDFERADEYFSERPALTPAPPPVGTNAREPLPFLHLSDPRTFEFLCWDVINGLLQEHEVFVYGRPGHAQKGVDIVALAPQGPRRRARNRYFQCKLYGDFGMSDLKDAVQKFERGILIHKARAFVIIAGCRVPSPEVLDELSVQIDRLKAEYDVKLSLLDAMRLTSYLAKRRDLIHRYFGESHDRSYISPIDETPDGYPGKQIYTGNGDELFPDDLDVGGYPGLLVVKNTDAHIQIDVPDQYSGLPLCGAITLRMLNHMQIGLDAAEVMSLFSDVRTPLEQRPFIRGAIDADQTTTTMMISGCRIYPSLRMATSFAEAIDATHDALMARLREFDRRYEAEGFQLVSLPHRGAFYRVGAIHPMVWECVRDAIADPTWSFEGTCSVQDRGETWLRIYTGDKVRGTLPHVDFHIRDDKHWPRSYSVLWETTPIGIAPDYATGWWGAETSVQWLVETLIPQAIKHRERRADRAWRNRPRWYAPLRKWETVVIPRFDTYVDRHEFIQRGLDKADTGSTLLTAVQGLQAYLNSERRTWDADCRRRMTTVLLIALSRAKLKAHSLRYIQTQIYDATAEYSQTELLANLERSLSRSAVLQSAEGDYFLRALMEMLDKGECLLGLGQVREIAEHLEPFARRHDDSLRLTLHTPEANR